MVDLEELFTKPRRSVASYGELLPWFGLASDRVVLCHDGSLLVAFEYEGFDIEGVLDDDVTRRIDLLQTALRQLTDRITLWSIQERRFDTHYPKIEYANPVAELIERQWAKKCTEQPNARFTHRLYLGYSYPSRSEAFFESMSAELEQDSNPFRAVKNVLGRRFGGRSEIASVRGQLAQMVEEFENIVGAFAGVVSGSFGFKRLAKADLLGDLCARANLASPKGPVSVPDRPVYLNTILPSDDLVRQGDLLEFKGPAASVFCGVISATGMPGNAYSKTIDALLLLPCEYVLVQTFQLIDRDAAIAAISKAEMFYKMERKSVLVRTFEGVTGVQSDKINTGNDALADDAQEAMVEATAGDAAFGYYNMTVLGLGPTAREANRSLDVIASSLRAGAFVMTRERQGLMSGFLGTLPGNRKVQLRKYLASTANVADLTPLRTIARGEPGHKFFSTVLKREVPEHIRFMTPYGVPFGFNSHAEDLGHAVVLGGSGSGKTSFMALFTTLFQKYFPCNSYIFDKDDSMSLLSMLLGGVSMNLSEPGQGGVRINPVYRMLADDNEAALLSWIDVLFASSGEKMTPEEQEKVSTAIQMVKSLSRSHWRLSMLYSYLAGSDKALALKLSPFVDRSSEEGSFAKGPYSEYFDNEVDSFSLSSIVCMETGKLLKTPEIAAPFMEYAFYCIEKSLDGMTPSLIYVEECWYMLSNPAFEAKIEDWLRTFRKKKAFVVFATQSPAELQRMRSWAAFIANVPTHIFLPSMQDSVSALADLYVALFGLNEEQLNLLSKAVPKRDYLICKPGVTRMVSAIMPPAIIAINEGTSNPDIRAQARALSEKGVDGWQTKFITEVLHVK